MTTRQQAVRDAVRQVEELERHLAHARLALKDILDPAHPRHLSVVDARDEAALRVRGVSDLADLLYDTIGNLPGIDPDEDIR